MCVLEYGERQRRQMWGAGWSDEVSERIGTYKLFNIVSLCDEEAILVDSYLKFAEISKLNQHDSWQEETDKT